MKACGVTVNSFLPSAVSPSQRTPYTVLDALESRRDEDPSARVEAARPPWIRSARSAGMRLHPKPARVESKFIDDHVAGADKPGGVAARRDWNCNGDRQAGRKQLLWNVEDGASCCSTALGLSTGRGLIGTSGGQCGQLKHEYKAGDARMVKMLLTVWEAADVHSVSRSRVYERLSAEQLDSVKIGSVSAGGTSFDAALGGRSFGEMNSRRPQGEGPTGFSGSVDRRTARPEHFHADAPSTRRGTATLARSIGPRTKPRQLLWTVPRQRGITPQEGHRS
jgi:hypothetical protein